MGSFVLITFPEVTSPGASAAAVMAEIWPAYIYGTGT